MDFSLQLWSVNADIENDYFGTLEAIAKMGYKGVEFAGYRDIPAEDMKAKLDELGLKPVGTHLSIDDMQEHIQREIEYSKIVGTEYIASSWATFETREVFDNVAETLNRAIAAAKPYGIKIAYHNHNQEFEKMDGEYVLELLAKACPELVFELDIYWVAYAGLDPIEYIKHLGERLEIVHMKQMGNNEDKKQSDIKDGIIDMFAVIDAAKYAKHFIIEQETGNVFPPMESAKNNIEFMNSKQ